MRKPYLTALLLIIGIGGSAQDLINQISYRNKDNRWELSSRTDFYYSQNGNDSLSEYLVYFQTLGTFQKRQLQHYYFNRSGLMDSLLRERWEGVPGGYVPRFRQHNHFNSLGYLDTSIEHMNTTGNWYMDGRTTFSYNSLNDEITRAYELHVNSNWEQVSLDSSFYDIQGRLELKKSYNYDSLGDIYLSRERHYKYNVNGELDQIIHFRQIAAGWDTNSVEKFIYSINGTLLEKRSILIIPGSHNPTTRERYTYLANGALDTAYFSSLMWDSTNTWIPNSKVAYTYSNSPINLSEYYHTIEVYPNPVQNYLKINNLSPGEKTICLRRLNGTLIKGLKTQGRSINLSTQELQPGVYILQIKIGADSYFRTLMKI